MKQMLAVSLVSFIAAFAANLVVRTAPCEQGNPPVDPMPVVPERSGGAPLAYAEERVVDLPEDGHTWHTILIVRPDWRQNPIERRAEAMFHSEPLLVNLKHQTHWHLITTDQAEFEKFRPLVDVTPCLVVERANGEVVYRESGPELGKRAHALGRALRNEIERHCPDGRCLPLHPVPGLDEPEPPADEIPAVLREPVPTEKKQGHGGMILAMLAGLGGGIAAHWRKTG